MRHARLLQTHLHASQRADEREIEARAAETARNDFPHGCDIGDGGFVIETLERGADDYLVKPFIPEELIARLSRLLARRGGKRA